jgi:sugar phosphate isomerase/epimerase
MSMKLPVALQLYSVRDDFANDMMGTLKQVKEMGYNGVELAGFGSGTPAEVKAALDEVGLKCISAHVGFDGIVADPEMVFAEYKSVGCEYIAIPWLDMNRAPGGDGFELIIPEIERVGKIAKDMGLTLLYHNHDFEFRKVGDKYGLDVLFEKVPAEYLQTQIDTCWVKFVNIDPALYIRKYKGRAPLVHIKDFTMDGKPDGTPYDLIGADRETKKAAMSSFSFKPVGSGSQDVPAILSAAEEAGTKWVIVEYDMSPEHPPLETARISLEYLKSLIAS